MSIIATLTVNVGDIELGSAVPIPDGGRVALDPIVPIGEHEFPLVWFYGNGVEEFERNLRSSDAVATVEASDRDGDGTLFEVEWRDPPTQLFDEVSRLGGQVLAGYGTSDTWAFELRFPDHDALSNFREYCEASGVTIELNKVSAFEGPETEGEPWYGLTEPQREALTLAVEEGYYDIPRKRTTVELAQRLDISDQALTERLRRAITSLVDATLLPRDDDAE